MQENVTPSSEPMMTPATGVANQIPQQSWLDQNIVPLLQMDSEVAFLQELQTFLQQLQAEQLAEPEVTEALIGMLANPPMVPDELGTFELSSNFVMVMAEHMENLVNILKEATPELAEQLNDYMSQIQMIAQTVPPTSDQINDLNNILASLNQMAQNLPIPVQAKLAQEEVAMYMALGPEIQNEISTQQARANMIQTQLEQPDVVTQRMLLQQQLSDDLKKETASLNTWVQSSLPLTLALIPPGILGNDFDKRLIDAYNSVNGEFMDLQADLLQLAEVLNSSTDIPRDLVDKINERISNLKAKVMDLDDLLKELPPSPEYSIQLQEVMSSFSTPINGVQTILDQVSVLEPITPEEIEEDIAERDDLTNELMMINESLASLQGFMDDFSATSAMIQKQSNILNDESTISASYLPLYQREIEGLIASAEAVSRGNPNAAAQMTQYINQLRAMDVSHLSDADVQRLNVISSGISQRVPEMPNFYQKQYWDAQSFMLQDQTAMLDEYGIAVSDLQMTIDGLEDDDPNKMILQSFLDSASDKTVALERAQASLEAAATFSSSRAFAVGSLPDDFRSAILDHYMPDQEAYLEGLANTLYFFNKGAEIGNQLLEDTVDFAGARDNYGFTDFLLKTDGEEYSGDFEVMQGELKREQDQARLDLMAIDKTISDIQDYITEVTNDPQLSDDQKQQIIDQLNFDIDNLMVAKGQVQNLSDAINQISVAKGSDMGHFTLVGPVDQIPTLEGIVINGDPGSTPPGGLVAIHSQIDADQKKYSDQSQNQQMILQMRMTEIQQEWTIVSTSLQLLNQMYLTVARGIYR